MTFVIVDGVDIVGIYDARTSKSAQELSEEIDRESAPG